MANRGLPKRARECSTLDELEAAKQAWWELAQRYDATLQFSSSCLSDIQARDEAHSNWKQCDLAYWRLQGQQGSDQPV